MGLLQWVAGGILAKSGHNKLNPPQVTVPSGYQMVGLKAKGMNEYTIKYKKMAVMLQNNLQFLEALDL